MKTKSSGLTLLEVLIASAILSVVVLVAFSTLHTSTSIASKGSVATRLEDRGVRFLAYCRDDMSAAQFSQSLALGGSPSNFSLGIPNGTPNSYNTAVGYRIPGNRDASGAVNASLSVVYGYNSPFVSGSIDAGFYQNTACILRFEAEEVLMEDGCSLTVTQAANWGTPFPSFKTLDSSVTKTSKFDMNGDGDRTDAFVRGKMVKYVVAPTGSTLVGAHTPLQINGVTMGACLLSRQVLSDNVILRVNSNAAGDFSADVEQHSPTTNSGLIFGFADPTTGVLNKTITLAANAAGIQIQIWHGEFDDTGRLFLMRKNSALIHFRTGSQG